MSDNAASNGQPQPGNGAGKPKRRKRRKGGTKTLLTREFIAKVEKLAAKGLTQRQIAHIMNVGACTLSIWKSKAGEATEKFAKAIARGEAKGVEMRLKRIEKAAIKGSWQADAWVLERRNPEQFGRRDAVSLSNPDGSAVQASTTVIAPTVVFVQPRKDDLADVIEVKPTNGTNGHGQLGLPEKDKA